MSDQDLVKITQTYYDSDDADTFYHSIWGGEDIHIGMYEPGRSISEASHKTVATMMEKVAPLLTPKTRVLDIGAGYGGAARHLARQVGCPVICFNLSKVENMRNREKNETQGLAHLIEVVEGNFENLPFSKNAFDLIWSEDAILHSGNKERVFEEAYRVLRPGGKMVFTDPMQADDCPPEVLSPVLERIHLKEMGSVKRYRAIAEQQGWKSFQAWEMPEQLVNHYQNVLQALKKQEAELVDHISPDYLARMKAGLQHWISAGKKGYLNWGILLMEK